jgi:hypothetical protein
MVVDWLSSAMFRFVPIYNILEVMDSVPRNLFFVVDSYLLVLIYDMIYLNVVG